MIDFSIFQLTLRVILYLAIVVLEQQVQEEGIDESSKEWIAASDKLKEISAAWFSKRKFLLKINFQAALRLHDYRILEKTFSVN